MDQVIEANSFTPESLRVTQRLRDDILDGVRAPGDRLVERDLADELGVSRVPVRDALRTLVAEGLVTARPRSWAVVREFTASDIADLIEVREAFELLTFRLAAGRRSRAGLQQLKSVVERELAAARRGDGVQARRAAADFHQVVTTLAANELLSELDRTLSSRMRWLFGQHDDLLEMAGQHQELYAAIADRDVARVEALTRQHVASGHAAAVAHLKITS